MSKYIKFDYIDNAIRERHANASSQEIGQELFELFMEISEFPTIDIVRCEDCRWQDDCSGFVKSMDGLVSTALTWCSDGERIEE